MKRVDTHLVRFTALVMTALFYQLAYAELLMGQVVPASIYQLDPGVSGKVKSVSVRVGERVLSGTLLLELESGYFAARLKAATAEVNYRKAEMEEASRSFERDSELFEEGSLSAVELEQRKILLLGATAAYQHSVAEQAGFNSKLDATRVFAPVAGKLIEKNVDPGQWINVNDSRKPSMVFVSSEPLVQALVSTAQVAALAPGDSLEISFEGGSTKGILTAIDTVTTPGKLLLTVRNQGSLPPVGHAVELGY